MVAIAQHCDLLENEWQLMDRERRPTPPGSTLKYAPERLNALKMFPGKHQKVRTKCERHAGPSRDKTTREVAMSDDQDIASVASFFPVLSMIFPHLTRG
jgi:hypothetical protein